jgi:hypothetical protein
VAFRLHAHVPLMSLSTSLGWVCWPCRHSEARGDKLIGGGGAILFVEGSATGLFQLAQA